jgi:hypothetical protein
MVPIDRTMRATFDAYLRVGDRRDVVSSVWVGGNGNG